jgi:uncharacterized protein (DUF362 family)
MDRAAKLQAGLELGRQIFVPLDSPGIPVTHRVVLKPNVVSVRSRTRPDVENWGTGTDPDFYEGIVMALKERGVRKFSFVEANLRWAWNYRGFVDINDRHGVEMNDPEIRPAAFHRTDEIVWSEVPEAVVYKRIPHYWPVNAPDTWLLNIAKWKAHGMCLTQSVKNEQGLVVTPYVRFCPGWSMVTGAPPLVKSGVCPDVEARVLRYFESHRRMGYYRYDQPAQGSYPDPLAHEIWCQKTCDNQSVLKTGLAMIEGIYGRDGDGFHVGNDYLTNLVLFSKDKFRLDVIGLWLGGHEPGNVHVYRVAKERGLSDTFNPWEIPIYEWMDGRAVPRKLSDFPRTPLKSPYMRQAGETLHLADEPFDYDKYKL